MSLSVDLLLAFSLFAFVTSVTPGPNNTMLLASGVNFGFVRSIPHILGISCGFFIMVMAVGFGLGTVFEAPVASAGATPVRLKPAPPGKTGAPAAP
ncbi:LysE family transporter, partial [Pseudomonas aeruginosa]|uniref:LysE family transporter n=1 Tax=Pseudomonas aeruginosa TaxID=287 RepID=UPI0004CEA52A